MMRATILAIGVLLLYAATIVAFVASLGVIAVPVAVDSSTHTLTFLSCFSRFTAAFFLSLIGFCGFFSWCLVFIPMPHCGEAR